MFLSTTCSQKIPKITKNNKLIISKCLGPTSDWRSAKTCKIQRIMTNFRLNKAHVKIFDMDFDMGVRRIKIITYMFSQKKKILENYQIPYGWNFQLDLLSHHYLLQSDITPLFQLQFGNHLKCWIHDFLNFKMIYGLPQNGFRVLQNITQS